jgi:hypothetical protein
MAQYANNPTEQEQQSLYYSLRDIFTSQGINTLEDFNGLDKTSKPSISSTDSVNHVISHHLTSILLQKPRFVSSGFTSSLSIQFPVNGIR